MTFIKEDMIQQYNKFKHKDSDIYDADDYFDFDSKYSLWCKKGHNILFVISADYDSNKKNEVHPIHYYYNYYGNEQFNRWLSDNAYFANSMTQHNFMFLQNGSHKSI